MYIVNLKAAIEFYKEKVEVLENKAILLNANYYGSESAVEACQDFQDACYKLAKLEKAYENDIDDWIDENNILNR